MQALGKSFMIVILANDIKMSPFVLIDLLLLFQAFDICIIRDFQANSKLICRMTAISYKNDCLPNLLTLQNAQTAYYCNLVAHAIIINARSTNKTQLEDLVNWQMKSIAWQKYSDRQQSSDLELTPQTAQLCLNRAFSFPAGQN